MDKRFRLKNAIAYPDVTGSLQSLQPFQTIQSVQAVAVSFLSFQTVSVHVRFGCGSVPVIFSIYLVSVLYRHGGLWSKHNISNIITHAVYSTMVDMFRERNRRSGNETDSQ